MPAAMAVDMDVVVDTLIDALIDVVRVRVRVRSRNRVRVIFEMATGWQPHPPRRTLDEGRTV